MHQPEVQGQITSFHLFYNTKLWHLIIHLPDKDFVSNSEGENPSTQRRLVKFMHMCGPQLELTIYGRLSHRAQFGCAALNSLRTRSAPRPVYNKKLKICYSPPFNRRLMGLFHFQAYFTLLLSWILIKVSLKSTCYSLPAVSELAGLLARV